MIGGPSGTRQEQDNLTMEVDLCQKKLERVGLPSTVMDHVTTTFLPFLFGFMHL